MFHLTFSFLIYVSNIIYCSMCSYVCNYFMSSLIIFDVMFFTVCLFQCVRCVYDWWCLSLCFSVCAVCACADIDLVHVPQDSPVVVSRKEVIHKALYLCQVLQYEFTFVPVSLIWFEFLCP